MIAKNSSVGLTMLVWVMSDIRKVSDSTSAVGKGLIPCFESDGIWRNIPETVRVFSCARNIQLLFSTVRIVVLRFVSKIFPESYDIAASMFL
jgi:hypothetical protein